MYISCTCDYLSHSLALHRYLYTFHVGELILLKSFFPFLVVCLLPFRLWKELKRVLTDEMPGKETMDVYCRKYTKVCAFLGLLLLLQLILDLFIFSRFFSLRLREIWKRRRYGWKKKYFLFSKIAIKRGMK